MTNLYPLNPADEVRECPGCDESSGLLNTYEGSSFGTTKCPKCNGTGMLGDPDAELVIRLLHHPRGRHPIKYYWAHEVDGKPQKMVGGFSTEAEALAAARAALGGE